MKKIFSEFNKLSATKKFLIYFPVHFLVFLILLWEKYDLNETKIILYSIVSALLTSFFAAFVNRKIHS